MTAVAVKARAAVNSYLTGAHRNRTTERPVRSSGRKSGVTAARTIFPFPLSLGSTSRAVGRLRPFTFTNLCRVSSAVAPHLWQQFGCGSILRSRTNRSWSVAVDGRRPFNPSGCDLTSVFPQLWQNFPCSGFWLPQKTQYTVISVVHSCAQSENFSRYEVGMDQATNDATPRTADLRRAPHRA